MRSESKLQWTKQFFGSEKVRKTHTFDSVSTFISAEVFLYMYRAATSPDE